MFLSTISWMFNVVRLIIGAFYTSSLCARVSMISVVVRWNFKWFPFMAGRSPKVSPLISVELQVPNWTQSFCFDLLQVARAGHAFSLSSFHRRRWWFVRSAGHAPLFWTSWQHIGRDWRQVGVDVILLDKKSLPLYVLLFFFYLPIHESSGIPPIRLHGNLQLPNATKQSVDWCQWNDS